MRLLERTTLPRSGQGVGGGGDRSAMVRRASGGERVPITKQFGSGSISTRDHETKLPSAGSETTTRDRDMEVGPVDEPIVAKIIARIVQGRGVAIPEEHKYAGCVVEEMREVLAGGHRLPRHSDILLRKEAASRSESFVG